jgi:hypothetical protein
MVPANANAAGAGLSGIRAEYVKAEQPLPGWFIAEMNAPKPEKGLSVELFV